MDALERMLTEAAKLQAAAAIPSNSADKLRATMLEVAETLISVGAYAYGPWRTMKMAMDELERPARRKPEHQ